MQIRTKLALMETLLVVGLLISIGIFLLIFNTVSRQQQFQTQVTQVMDSLNDLEDETGLVLFRQEPLTSVRRQWSEKVVEFNESIMILNDIRQGLTEHQQEQLDDILGFWKQTNEWYFLPALEQLYKIAVGSVGELVNNDSVTLALSFIMDGYYEGEQAASGELITLVNYVDLIDEEMSKFVGEFTALNDSINARLDSNTKNAWGLGISLVILTLAITIFISARFSRLLVNRIHLVDDSMSAMASGDFSSELDIKSGDEFEDLSKHFNILKDQMQEKLNSVLNFMLSIATSLEGGPDLDEILSIITSSAVANTDACGAGIYLIDSDEQVLEGHAFSGNYIPPYPVSFELNGTNEDIARKLKEIKIPVGEHSIGVSAQDAHPLFFRSSEDLIESGFNFSSQENGEPAISSLIISPLTISHRVLGTIVIMKRVGQKGFTDLDFTHMQTFGDYAALTIDNLYNTEELIEKREMHREISIAADIQKGLLPRVMPVLDTAQIAAFSEAARGISGDYYDAFLMDKSKIGVVICDVVGKGVPASLLMVMIRTIIRLVSNPQRTPGKLLTFLNKGIIGRIGTEHFATMSIFSYDEETKTISYSNAAHPPLLIYRPREKSFIELDTPGLPIGVEKSESYQERKFSVEAGDVLALFTDGITEARAPDGREYTTDGLKSRLRLAAGKSAKEITKAIKDDLDSFTSGKEQHDDQTLIVVKIS